MKNLQGSRTFLQAVKHCRLNTSQRRQIGQRDGSLTIALVLGPSRPRQANMNSAGPIFNRDDHFSMSCGSAVK